MDAVDREKVKGYNRMELYLAGEMARVSRQLHRLQSVKRDPNSKTGEKLSAQEAALTSEQESIRFMMDMLCGNLVHLPKKKKGSGMFREGFVRKRPWYKRMLGG